MNPKRANPKKGQPPTRNSPKASPPKRDANFRENPNRAIYVFGEINQELVQKLTPEIIKLRHFDGTQPITVYIDSPGGAIPSYEHLEGLLFKPDQDGNRPRIITVATSTAASAAARLLVRGDYSMAYPNATIHCHGARFGWDGKYPVTKEKAESMSESLAAFNAEMAEDFTHKIIENLPWLYRFNEKKAREKGKEKFPDLDPAKNLVPPLTLVLLDHVGEAAQNVIASSLQELEMVSSLEAFLQKPSRSEALRKAELLGSGHRDCKLLKLIIDFLESNLHPADKKAGLQKATTDDLFFLYALRRDYYEKFVQACEDPEPLLMMFCEAADLQQAASMTDDKERKKFLKKKANAHLFHVWQLATTMSARLSKGENSLSANEAYWLGLIDEVVGSQKLCRRQLLESTGC